MVEDLRLERKNTVTCIYPRQYLQHKWPQMINLSPGNNKKVKNLNWLRANQQAKWYRISGFGTTENKQARSQVGVGWPARGFPTVKSMFGHATYQIYALHAYTYVRPRQITRNSLCHYHDRKRGVKLSKAFFAILWRKLHSRSFVLWIQLPGFRAMSGNQWRHRWYKGLGGSEVGVRLL